MTDLPPLTHGAHDTPDDGLCLLEAVALLSGERHSDAPVCVSSVLASFGRRLNDAILPARDDLEPRLRAIAPRLVGTAGRPDLDQRAGLMAADWLVRCYTPAWLRLAGLTERADALAGCAEITSWDMLAASSPDLDAAREDAAADRCAAWDAAWDAADHAADHGARHAAGHATRAAGHATRAAWDATRAAGAAAGAAGAATRDALAPTVRELQSSALSLFERMVALYKVIQ